jgi:transcriptional regulator with XRE-family HTH domain
MTQRDVAEALGKPPSWIARIETKERRMDVIEFVAIARALEIKEHDLLRDIASALPRKLDI